MDRMFALALRDQAVSLLGPALVLQLLLVGLMAWPDRPRTWRVRTAGPWMLLLAIALVVRVVVYPLARHTFDGHEADYFDAWRGRAASGAMGYRFYPALAKLYGWGGDLCGGSGPVLEAVSVAVGLLVVGAGAALMGRLIGDRRAAWAVALLLAVDPGHAFWSSSAYNVMIPLLLSLLVLLAWESGLRAVSARRIGVAALLWVLAVACRLEALLVVLPAAALLWGRWRELRSLLTFRLIVALMPALLLGVQHAFALGLHVPRPEGADSPFDYAAAMFALQAPWRWPFGPLAHVSGLVLGGVGVIHLARGGTQGRRALAFVALAVVPLHLIYAGFDDYGTRHTLLGRVAWAGAVGVGGVALWTARCAPVWARVAPAAALGLALTLGIQIGAGLWDENRRYYATPAAFLEDEPAFAEAAYTTVETWEGSCLFVSESWFYREQRRASHFEILDPERFNVLWEQYDGCLIFVYDLENYQRSSRAIDERAAKLRAFFPLRLLGKRLRPEVEDYALLYRIGRRPGYGPTAPGPD